MQQLGTFQELQASQKCLFFTEDGVCYLDHGVGGLDMMMKGNESIGQHSAGTPYPQWILQTKSYLDSVLVYTKKCLTFPEDVLQAFCGYLATIYGPRTVFGLPWSDLDRATLWYVAETEFMGDGPTPPLPHKNSEDLPSWSWISFYGSKKFYNSFTRGFALACWCRVQIDGNSQSQNLRLVVAEPSQEDYLKFDGSDLIQDRLKYQVSPAAIAWLEGCISTPAPPMIQMNCTRAQYEERLSKQWSSYISYWRDAFGQSPFDEMLSVTDIERCALPTRLLVHSQKARFTLEIDGAAENSNFSNTDGCHESCKRYHVRNAAGRLVGNMICDPHDVVALQDLGPEAEFIALSTCIDDSRLFLSKFNEENNWSSDLYGCPCRHAQQVMVSTVNYSPSFYTGLKHIQECYRHPEFSIPLANQEELEKDRARTRRQHRQRELNWSEIWRHYASVSYYDVEGSLMHDWWNVPKLYVMLIIPSTGKGKGDGVYQRLGIGTIYLKSWVEARPKFERVVLE